MQATLDRSAVMDKAARSMLRGELDTALKLYLQIFDNDPHDWSVGNAVGDLYVRMGKPDDAVSHFTMLAEQLAADGFAAKARALYRKIVRLQPGNDAARKRVDELDRQTAGETSPFLKRVLETARTMRGGAVPEPVTPPAPPPAAVVETVPPVALTAPDRDQTAENYRLVDTTAAAAIARGDYRGAAGLVEAFLAEHPHHVLALELLVDIAVEGAFDQELDDAQRRLAEGCVKAGHYRQAFDIAVDLCTRHPNETRHHEQLGRIVEIARTHGRTFVIPSFAPERERECAPEREPEPERTPAPASAPQPPPGPRLVPERDVEITIEMPRPAGRSIAIGPPFGDLLKDWSDPDRLLEEIRTTLLEEAAAAAEEAFTQGVRLADARQFGEAGRPLEEAMCLPHLRVPAGAQLARVYRDSDAPLEAMAILEWVAEMAPADEDSGHQLAYELALTLEALGQESQALGVYRELLAEVGPGYRDVALRVERLAAA